MDEQGLADHIANDPRDDLDWMVRRAKLKEPRSGAAWTRQLEVITIQPAGDEEAQLGGLRVHRHPSLKAALGEA